MKVVRSFFLFNFGGKTLIRVTFLEKISSYFCLPFNPIFGRTSISSFSLSRNVFPPKKWGNAETMFPSKKKKKKKQKRRTKAQKMRLIHKT